VQGKLLRFIEEKRFRRVGGTKDLSVDARVVAATNRDLERRSRPAASAPTSTTGSASSRCRSRRCASARRRGAAGPSFVATFAREFGKRIRRISPEAMELLERYPWPGNVRELRNVLERSVLLWETARS
jgi:two-component system, NtrC family, response regulator AtoC